MRYLFFLVQLALRDTLRLRGTLANTVVIVCGPAALLLLVS